MKRIAHKRLLEVSTCPVLADKYPHLIQQADVSYRCGRYAEALEYLNQIPTTDILYARLLVNLEGKRVLKTLQQIDEGKITDKYTILKAVSSLFTHVVIECEQGNTEFAILFPRILDRIHQLAYQG